MITDKVSPQYKKLIAGLREASITVGIHSDEGAKAHDEENTILDIAIKNEFGAVGVPERSFIRAWFDASKDAFTSVAEKEALAALEDGDVERHATRIALWAQGQIQQRIADGIQPENSPTTIERKGSSTPLIDKGVLRSSIIGKAELGAKKS